MKTVFFDVDTQLDFVFPAGALAVPGAAAIVANLGALTRYAAAAKYQIVSTVDAHTEDDPEFKIWKPHCVAGTTGQQKCSATLLPQPPKVLTSRPQADLQPFAAAAQIIVEKQMLDCFTNPNLPALLNLLAADRYVVYGVVSEYCVKCATVGLLKLGAQINLVSDAIKTLDPAAEKTFLAEFTAAGGQIVTTAAIVGNAH